jgi:hypothetical protein
MQDFPGNSQRAKEQAEAPKREERPKVERITTAEAVQRKPGLGRKFKETFIGGTGRMAFEYMVTDVVVPAIRDTLFDALQGGLDRLIYGESRRRGSSGPTGYSNVGHVNYQRMSTSTTRPPASTGTRMLSRKSRARHDFGELVIASRVEADEVLDRMYETLSRHEVVYVGDLYEMTGIDSSHADYKWGWTQLRGARVSRMRTGGYLLDLPEPIALD